jgi:hypothetical protein
VSWRLSGTYLEVCNCEAICPCRRIDGISGGRSTYGECEGALSWRILEGELDGLDVSELGVVLALWYSDDEARSPWSWILYLDERADAGRRAALEDVFTGRRGGTPVSQFPWAFKPSNLLHVVPSRIARPFETQSPVTCIIPGHHRTGREVVAERLEVHDGQLDFAYSGRCGYEATFEYSSAQA